MTQFDESRLCFSFGKEWQIIKVEDHPDCKQVFKKTPGIKDVDFLGIHQEKIFFIEAKNYSSDLVKNENKIEGETLSNALVEKFCDTLFIVLTAHIRYKRPGWEMYAPPISQGKTIKYVAWVELDYQSRNAVNEKRKKALWSILEKKIKQKLAKLQSLDKNFYVMVTSSSLPSAIPDVVVSESPCP